MYEGLSKEMVQSIEESEAFIANVMIKLEEQQSKQSELRKMIEEDGLSDAPIPEWQKEQLAEILRAEGIINIDITVPQVNQVKKSRKGPLDFA